MHVSNEALLDHNWANDLSNFCFKLHSCVKFGTKSLSTSYLSLRHPRASRSTSSSPRLMFPTVPSTNQRRKNRIFNQGIGHLPIPWNDKPMKNLGGQKNPVDVHHWPPPSSIRLFASRLLHCRFERKPFNPELESHLSYTRSYLLLSPAVPRSACV